MNIKNINAKIKFNKGQGRIDLESGFAGGKIKLASNVNIDDEDKKSEYKISISDNITSSQWFSNEKNITPVSYEQKIIKICLSIITCCYASNFK